MCCKFYTIVMLALAFFATKSMAANKFVSTTGNGNGDSWATAAGPSSLAGFINGGHNVYVAAGLYNISSSLLTGSGPFFIQGGYPNPSSAGAYQGNNPVVGYNPSTNISEFNGGNSVQILGTFVNASRTLTVKGIKFKNGSSSSRAGGVLRVENATSGTVNINFTDCVFDHNQASSAVTYSGGALSFLGASYNVVANHVVTITNCVFNDNHMTGAASGGTGGGAVGFQTLHGTVTFSKCSFTNNSSSNQTGASGGGAIYVNSIKNITINDSYFCSNSAPILSGGAIV